jgi:hypothetical protein
MILLLLHACLLLGPGPSIRCEDEFDCPGDMACGEDGLCIGAECDVLVDGSCSYGSHCEDGVCVPGCEWHDDCGGDVCDTETGQCVECTTEYDCDAGGCVDGERARPTGTATTGSATPRPTPA